jgi:putative ABC transport system permease protein
MRLKDALIVAVRAMRSAKLRSALTMLGIIVGVAAVVLLVGLGAGLRSGFDQAFNQLATRITVSKAGANQPGVQIQPLTETDLAAVERADPEAISRVLPLRSGSAVLRYGSNTYRASVSGSSPDYPVLNSRTMAAGAFFTDADDANRERVVVLAGDAVRYLFQDDTSGAIGQTVTVGRVPLKVVGVMARDGQTDNVAIVPLSTSRVLLAGAQYLNAIGVVAAEPTRVYPAIDAIYRALDPRHRIKDAGSRDYRVSAQVTQLDKIFSFIKFLTFFTVGVAALSLFVGALGVANIMLVTVTERTSEIGIKKAIGARRSAILKQFLTESVLLAGIGGVLGAALGIGLTVLSAALVARYVPQSGPPVVDPRAVAIAFAVSLGIGLVAGTYPAYRAARMHPIDALRY